MTFPKNMKILVDLSFIPVLVTTTCHYLRFGVSQLFWLCFLLLLFPPVPNHLYYSVPYHHKPTIIFKKIFSFISIQFVFFTVQSMTSREIDKLVAPNVSERKTNSTSLSFSFHYTNYSVCWLFLGISEV